MGNVFGIVSGKAQLWTLATEQKTSWFKAWLNVLLCIFAAVSALNLISTLLSLVNTTNIDVISLLQSMIGSALVIVTFCLTRKCDKLAFIMNIVYISWAIFGYIVSICTAGSIGDYMRTAMEVAMSATNASTADSERMQLVINTFSGAVMMITIVIAVIMLALYVLNLVYFIKRKALFMTSVEELQKMADEKNALN